MDSSPAGGGFLVSRRAIKANRKIGFNHLAFFRGYLEGLSLTKLGAMYLETGDDPVFAKQTLDSIQQELISAARRRNQPAMARAIQIGPERLVLTVADVESSENPTLEEFTQQVDPSGFFREEELVEMFEKRFKTGQAPTGSIDRAERIRRIHRRQMAALTALEGWVATHPSRTDPLESWLHEAVAARLNVALIHSVGDLLLFVDKHGRRWWERVQGLGEIGAERLTTWLEANKHSLGASVQSVVEADFKALGELKAKQRPLCFGVVPLPFLAIPDELSGPGGANLDHPEISGYKTDLEAIYGWIRTIDHSPHTARAYRIQAERFYLWCLIEARKSLSSIAVSDCEDYLEFLKRLDEYDPNNPAPEGEKERDEFLTKQAFLERWVSVLGKKSPQWREEWRPFAGRLNKISLATAHTVLNTMFQWLTEQRYLLVNPWTASRRKAHAKRRIKSDHALTMAQYKIVVKQCAWITHPEKRARMLFLLWLAFSTGLRRGELASPRLGDLTYHSSAAEPFWELTVLGKGKKERTVPITGKVIELLQGYLVARGHSEPILACNPYLPLVAVLNYDETQAEKLKDKYKQSVFDSDLREELSKEPPGITGNAIYENLQRHFLAAAMNGEICDLADRPRLLDATTHWLRHTFATQALDNGAAQQDVADILGHADLQTVAIYTNPEKVKKHRTADSLVALASE